jgi:hypothetical protein
MPAELWTVPQVKAFLGDRFARVCAGGRCCPVRVGGRRLYLPEMVERGLRRDLERYPGVRRASAVVTKSHGGPQGLPARLRPAAGGRWQAVTPGAPAPPVRGQLLPPSVARDWEECKRLFRRIYGPFY